MLDFLQSDVLCFQVSTMPLGMCHILVKELQRSESWVLEPRLDLDVVEQL